MYWMMGGFGGVDWRQGWLMVLLIPVILWMVFEAQPLNILALGETSARQLGMPIDSGATCWLSPSAGWWA